jgi:hypothetical protein
MNGNSEDLKNLFKYADNKIESMEIKLSNLKMQKEKLQKFSLNEGHIKDNLNETKMANENFENDQQQYIINRQKRISANLKKNTNSQNSNINNLYNIQEKNENSNPIDEMKKMILSLQNQNLTNMNLQTNSLNKKDKEK